MNRICKEYIKEVKLLFPVKGKNERAYIRKLSSDVETYCEEANVTEKQQLYDNYGEPLEVVNGYFSAVDTEYIMKKVNAKKYITACVAGVLSLVIVASCMYSFFSYRVYLWMENTTKLFEATTPDEIIIIKDNEGGTAE